MFGTGSFGGGERRRFQVGGALVIAVVLFVLVAAPAEAARQITPPQWFACGKYPANISIGPPRIWSSYNRPEHVVWMTQIQRWNGPRWYLYGKPYTTHSTFNYYGQSVTSWGSEATSTGGRYANSSLNLRVEHIGYYRLAVSIGGLDGGVKWFGLVRGGANCYMN